MQGKANIPTGNGAGTAAPISAGNANAIRLAQQVVQQQPSALDQAGIPIEDSNRPIAASTEAQVNNDSATQNAEHSGVIQGIQAPGGCAEGLIGTAGTISTRNATRNGSRAIDDCA